ncbi:SNF2 domain-containing protein CLASSY 3-like [Amaranthus tricolor]|uniref:SNF2 domain-containing protein CLASSY 3-like n=1 Tax=Amaranthus tricolor TaxID=29722 RepID=UPI00258BB471|nr:SNF2 domain-containing protein CLASSY 3-like [Amaranthus tricolor]
MDYMPIGRRTRLQKSLNEKRFRKEYSRSDSKVKIDEKHVSISGFSLSKDEEEEECLMIDETEFVNGISARKLEKNSPSKIVGNKNNADLGRFHDGFNENFEGFEDKGKKAHDDDNVAYLDDDDNDDGEMNKGISDDDEKVKGKRIIQSDDDGDADGGDDGKMREVISDEDKEIKGKRIMNDDSNDNANVDCDVHDADDDEEEEEERRSKEVEFKRRMFEGMYVPVYLNNNSYQNSFIGQRTRSRCKYSNPKKKANDGTFSHPINIDLESSSTSSSSDDDHGDDDVDDDDNDDDFKPKSHQGEKRKRGRPPLKKSKEKEVSKKKQGLKRQITSEVLDTLLNATLEDYNKGSEDLLDCFSKLLIPLNFRYGVQKSEQKNAEQEINEEAEFLFKEMEMEEEQDEDYLFCNIGLEASIVNDRGDEDEHDVPCNSAKMHESLCLKGKHCWILDEEIGMKCKICSFVKLEIRHVMPDFNENPFGPRKDNRNNGSWNDISATYESHKFMFPERHDDQSNDDSPLNDTFETVWDLVPAETKKTLYPHQKEGIELIWRTTCGGIRIDELATELTKPGVGGCIICHAPGTGKTRLAIVFLQSFMKKYPNSKPVIIAPCSMLQTWEEEFARWNVDVPFFNVNNKELSEKENNLMRKCGLQKLNLKDEKLVRVAKIGCWSTGKGVLGISYRLFQRLASDNGKEKEQNENIRELLLEKPDILVLDEGHTPRNDKSKSLNVLSQVATKRRVILSGTPFQNNLEEFKNTISLVREDFGYLSSEFSCSYLSDRRIEKLKKRMKDFVHVYSGAILKETLLPLFHSVIFLRPSNLQKLFFSAIRSRYKFIENDYLTSVASVHPSIFCGKKLHSSVDQEWKDLLEKHRTDIRAGVKLQFLVELINLCKGERVLVFAQYLPPLNFIEDFLKFCFDWTRGREIVYIDGEQDMKERHSSIKLFNDPMSDARVLLASTKACCEGINLVGASRVVLLDVVWNPSVERQAISRAYRIGQKRNVFVYHLISLGTVEEEKYRRKAMKARLSERLFFSCSPDGEAMHKKSAVSEDCILKAMIHHEKTRNMFENIISQPRADDLVQSFSLLNF